MPTGLFRRWMRRRRASGFKSPAKVKNGFVTATRSAINEPHRSQTNGASSSTLRAIYHIRDRRFIASYPEEELALGVFAFGYLDEAFQGVWRPIGTSMYPVSRSLVGSAVMKSTSEQMNDISSVHAMPVEIIKAIVGVMGKVKKLAKGGNNTFQRYKFTSVDQFYEALGHLMSEHDLCDVAFERSISVETRETTNDRGETKKGVWMTAEYDFYLYHGSGVQFGPISRTITVQASGPQSFAAAQSFSEKYFLRNLFKVPTGDKDEIDQSEQEGLPTGNVVNLRADKKISDTRKSKMIQTALKTLTDKGVEAAMLKAVRSRRIFPTSRRARSRKIMSKPCDEASP